MTGTGHVRIVLKEASGLKRIILAVPFSEAPDAVSFHDDIYHLCDWSDRYALYEREVQPEAVGEAEMLPDPPPVADRV